MKVLCLTCKQSILPENVNMAANSAHCSKCKVTYDFSELLYGHCDQVLELPNDPPKGSWFKKLDDGFEIGAKNTILYLWSYTFLIFYCIPICIDSILHPENSSIIGLLFLFLATLLLMLCLFTKTDCTVKNGQGTVFFRIGPYGWCQRFAWNDVYCVRERCHKKYRDIELVFYDSDKTITFGTFIDPNSRYYVLRVMKFMENTNRLKGRNEKYDSEKKHWGKI